MPWTPKEEAVKTMPTLTINDIEVNCHRLFRPKISKVKTRFVVEILQVSNTLTPNVGVSDYRPV